jgi:hypothetical protein
MKWQNERDLLIAQTMAFVQSVTEKTAEVGNRTKPISPREPVTPEPPRETLNPSRLALSKHNDVREEIQRRVAAFRARQQLFHRERDEYCNATLARARALIEQAAKASERHKR